jgi:hypothetical protein
MPTYSTQKLLDASASQIPQIAEAIRKDFADDGFEVYVDTLMSGGRDISITKGNLFKAVLGMRSALKISLTPRQSGVFFDANVGIYGQQAIPTIISMLFFWPVLITQIWGLVQQSSLDDRALEVAEKTISITKTTNESTKYCTNCGTKIDVSSKYCPSCGVKLQD